MSRDEWTLEDTARLDALIAQAEREGKWLHCHYQDLWFSPAELRKQNATGHFRWGVVNWTLRDPLEKLREAESAARRAQGYADRVRSEIAATKP